jgi:hypothetical protein
LIVFTAFILSVQTQHAAMPGDDHRHLVARSPWGISSSASAMRNHAEWMPKLAAAGVTRVRLFPEWRSIEPAKGTRKWDEADALVRNAAASGIEINAVLMGSPPTSKKAHAFPMDDLEGWSQYVSAVVGRYHDRIHHWEVWNEGNGGFNDGGNTTEDYATLAIATYEAAKRADPQANVGLSVASFDEPYLRQTMLAMARAGKPGSFDFLCVHPYEIMDGLGDPDGEVPFLWIVERLRDTLRAAAPERSGAEIWITELGCRIESKRGRTVTEQDAAKRLVKAYTMAAAQGVACVQWFEAQDPIGEDQGFGVIARDGKPRTSYHALQRLTAAVGTVPKYVGWIALGKSGRGYGFVFTSTSAEGKLTSTLVAWMPAGLSEDIGEPLAGRDVRMIDAVTGAATAIGPERAVRLTEMPLLATGLESSTVEAARKNAGKPFPWGGNFAGAATVACQLGERDVSAGIARSRPREFPSIRFPDGSTGIVVPGDIEHDVRFYVHPSFAEHAKEYYVRATVRRLGAGNVGMNLIYEIADSKGKSPYANAENWFGVNKDDGWQTYTWHMDHAAFSKMWGNDFAIRPEQSVPFAIGKIEVSTTPFAATKQ